MKHTTTQHWIAALRYLIDADDAPQSAQDSARYALDAHDRATKLHDNEQRNANLALQTQRTLERDTPRHAADKVAAGKNVDLGKIVDKLTVAHHDSSTAQTRALVAQRVRSTFTVQVEGACLNPYRGELLRWIATRRNNEPTRCGEIETLPHQVQVIYSNICTTWLTPWDDTLTLDGITRLPLLYQPTWKSDLRASLAWVWEQVARGNFEVIPHPRATDPESAALIHVPTHRVITLPKVPRPTTPANTRK